MTASSRSICALWASSYCRELCFCSSCEQHLRPVCCCDFKPRPCQLNDGLWKKSLVMRGDEEIPHADIAHAKALRACGARPQALEGQDDRFRPCLHSQHETVAESGCSRSPSLVMDLQHLALAAHYRQSISLYSGTRSKSALLCPDSHVTDKA